MSWFRNFWKDKSSEIAQRQQVDESMRRISESSHRKVEEAKAKLENVAEDMKGAVGRRIDESTHLRDVLNRLIDKQSHGRFDMSRGSSRN